MRCLPLLNVSVSRKYDQIAIVSEGDEDGCFGKDALFSVRGSESKLSSKK